LTARGECSLPGSEVGLLPSEEGGGATGGGGLVEKARARVEGWYLGGVRGRGRGRGCGRIRELRPGLCPPRSSGCTQAVSRRSAVRGYGRRFVANRQGMGVLEMERGVQGARSNCHGGACEVLPMGVEAGDEVKIGKGGEDGGENCCCEVVV
jgi:hypothetical protein